MILRQTHLARVDVRVHLIVSGISSVFGRQIPMLWGVTRAWLWRHREQLLHGFFDGERQLRGEGIGQLRQFIVYASLYVFLNQDEIASCQWR